MGDKEDFTMILVDGLSLEPFGFDDRSLRVFTKVMVDVVGQKLPHLKIFRVNDDVFYYGGSIYVELKEDALQFRMYSQTVEDKVNAGKFCMAVIGFVGDALRSLFEPKKKSSPPIIDEKDLEDSEDSEEDSGDWWI